MRLLSHGCVFFCRNLAPRGASGVVTFQCGFLTLSRDVHTPLYAVGKCCSFCCHLDLPRHTKTGRYASCLKRAGLNASFISTRRITFFFFFACFVPRMAPRRSYTKRRSSSGPAESRAGRIEKKSRPMKQHRADGRSW